MIKNNVYYEFFASYTVPNSDEVGYWVDLGANSKGKIIKVYNQNTKQWVKVTDATSEDAVSPFIGSNGNWWVDNRDTGIPAAGKNPYIGDNGNWWVYDALANDYIDTGVIAKGTSAYDIAVSNGFQGTEQEWLESLKEPAKKAAEEALKAAEEANEAADRVDEGLTSVNEAIEEANTAIDNAEQATANAQEVAINTPKIVDIYWYVYDLNTHSYVNTFVEAVGKSFKIVKSYLSEDALMADFDNPEVDYGEFVWIRTGNVEDPEDSRLYLKTEEGWDLVGDLSGMQGIEGQSAYEIAVEHGYVGSEDDWLQSIKQPALDAADEALTAKDEIIAAQDSIEAAEAARVEAEKDREEAEGVRASNEATRQQQEAEREKDTADAISAVNEAKNATEAAIEEAQTQADRAKDYADNPPKIENDKWYLWSEVTDSYLDTGVKATGIHGKSPYIEGGTWWVYNDETDEYWDTSISVNSDYVLTKAKVEGVLTGDITSHNHDSRYVKDAPADGKQYARMNSNWSEVVIPEIDLSNYLAKDNVTEFTPDADYEPATKKYVDDNISTVNEDLQSSKERVAANLILKVDKVEGKQLSTNDYTNEEKSKLSGIAAGAEVNVNADWNATEGDAQILNKPIIITEAEVDQKINSAIASVYRVKGSVANYESLPTTDVVIGDVWNLEDTGANYVATSTTPTWDKLSETVDLSGYLTKAEASNTYQPKGNYITSIPEEYITETELTEKNYATKSEIPTNVSQLANDSGYLTAIPDEYVTESELTSKNYATKGELPTKVSELTNDSGYITSVPEEYVTSTELEDYDYATSTEVSQAITAADAPSDGSLYGKKNGEWTTIDLSNVPTADNILTKNNTTEYIPTGDYNPATKKYVDDAINGIGNPSISDITGIDSNWLTLLQVTPTDHVTRWPTWDEVTEKPEFSNVATSGAYTDLIGTPELSAVATSGSYEDLTGTPSLATVAVSGSYSDLVNTPDIVSPENVLQTNNNTEYTPTGDYNPATKKYVDDSVSTINSSVTNLISFMNFYEGANTVTTLSTLPVDKRSVVANLGSASDLTLSNAIPVGREIYIRIYNTSSVGFDQPIPSTGAFHSMNGSSVTIPGYSWIEMSIWCYAEGNYSIRIGEIN